MSVVLQVMWCMLQLLKTLRTETHAQKQVFLKSTGADEALTEAQYEAAPS